MNKKLLIGMAIIFLLCLINIIPTIIDSPILHSSIFGLRISIFIGVAGAFLSSFIGVLYGSFLALSSKQTHLSWIVNLPIIIPSVLIAILVNTFICQGTTAVILVITFSGWARTAKMISTQISSLLQKDFLVASKLFGAGKLHIFRYHISTHILGPVITTFLLAIPKSIFRESYLSFLGLGLNPPMTSLGSLIIENSINHQTHIEEFLIPASLIVMTILSFNLIGEGCRDICEK